MPIVKMRKLTLIVCILLILTIAGLKLSADYSHAQSPKLDLVTYRLNPEASQVYLEIEKAKADLTQKFQILQAQQMALMIGAGIPASERDRAASVNAGIVECAPKVVERAKKP